jgi:hypothetical protein
MTSRKLVGLLAICGLVAACGGPSGHPSPTAQVLLVTVKAGAGENQGVGAACGDENFGDQFSGLPGTQVTVTNEGGTTVGIGTVPTAGVIAERSTPGGPFGVYTEDCVFTFTIPLAGTATFYKFDFGTKFGSRSMSAADVDAANDKVVFDLVGS